MIHLSGTTKALLEEADKDISEYKIDSRGIVNLKVKGNGFILYNYIIWKSNSLENQLRTLKSTSLSKREKCIMTMHEKFSLNNSNKLLSFFFKLMTKIGMYICIDRYTVCLQPTKMLAALLINSFFLSSVIKWQP